MATTNMTPYYEQDGITIYHGDCRDVLGPISALRGGSNAFDLLLTDPPYGIGAARNTRGNKQHGRAVAPSKDYGASDWDECTQPEMVALSRGICRWAVIFGGNYYDLPLSRCWLVWDKDNGENDYADCELAWTNFDKPVRKLRYRWHGMLQESGCAREHRQHPTQKPEPVMRWALMQAPSDVVRVLDPFMGSGTTLVAAKRLGKRAVGIEREERYCEIAAERLQQRALFGEELQCI